ncbi:MAG: TonB-dependent receptor, partial [Sphingomonadales bacterium]
ILSYTMSPGIDPLNAGLVTPTGNAFRNAYFKDEINQIQLKGRYDHDGGFLDSIDAGFSYVENKVRSAYGFIQNETWGGVGPASAVPDDLFDLISLPDRFPGVRGAGTAGMIPALYSFNFERMADLLEANYKICSNPGAGRAAPGTCLADYTTDRRITEKTISPYIQFNTKFDLFGRDSHIIAGIRYDQTNIDSTALVPIPTGTRWTGGNEFAIDFAGADFTRFKGSYQNWLPSIDFDVEPMQNVKLRASYSHTITRADYASLQGGRTIDTNPRIGGGTGSQGNPGLLPYKSKNIDFSAEWYYSPGSYVSVGYFNKDVSNYIGTNQVNTPAFDLRNPAAGPRYQQAVAALGTNDALRVRDYILRNFPGSSQVTGTILGTNGETLLNGNIFGVAADPLYNFQISQPFNSDQTANINGWEFAIQHRFWETGFGTILNYTIVNGNANYDNTVSPYVSQFAITGLSNSANAVIYYDKGGLQARVAYNWRDEFYAGGTVDPTYVEAYGQFDASASYEFVKGLTVFVEGINITGEGRRGHRRSNNFATFVQPGYARYSGGVRFSF